MVNVKEFVQSLNLDIGQTTRLNCPACAGVNTFVATRHADSLVTYHCYRPICDTKGGYRANMTAEDVTRYREKVNNGDIVNKGRAKFELPESTVANVPVHTNEDVAAYVTKYPWVLDYFDLRWDARENRLVYVVYDMQDDMVDAIGRSVVVNHKQPKSRFYGDGNTPVVLYSEDNARSHRSVVVVEDICSAVRLNILADFNVVALSGTYMKPSYIPYLTQFDKCVIMLDADALDKNIKMANQMDQYMPSKSYSISDYDVKDLPKDRFEGLCEKLYKLGA